MSNVNWKTPPKLFNLINTAVGGFKVDAAADQFNHLLPHWYGPGSPLAEDALDPFFQWLSPAWCNPPYGKGLEKWLKQFEAQGASGVGVVALIPASVETGWWHDWVAKGLEGGSCDVIFLKGRVNFLKPCAHCERTGQCEETFPEAATNSDRNYMCCNRGVCEVCDGTGYVEGGSPRFPSALVFYGPTTTGKIGWLDWKQDEENKVDSEQDPLSGSDSEGRE